MRNIKTSLLFSALMAMSSVVSAATFHFTGTLNSHNDVVLTSFVVGKDSTNVLLWTDSYKNGLNFDPIAALWNAATGELIHENDDNASISSPHGERQTVYDVGIKLPVLAAGTYYFTVTRYPNFRVSDNYADGFRYDGAAGNPLTSGKNWSVWLDNVDTASNPSTPLPAPASLLLLGTGLLGGWVATKKKRRLAAR